MKICKRILKWFLYALGIFLLLVGATVLVVRFSTQASNERAWNDDQALLPYAELRGDQATIYNIRNFTYASTTSFTPSYYDKTFDVSRLVRVWYIVEPFSGIPGSAHTFLSFEFEGNEFVAISVEIRKEKGESYHPVSGLFNQYELMYVIADERDVVKLRSNYRKDLVFLYPIKTTKEKSQALFLDMLQRATALRDEPEFYNTITNTCTTNIVRHINTITPQKVPLFDLRILLPENSDLLAYELGLLDTTLSFEDARRRHLINERAERYADDPLFSVKIRGEQ